MEWTAIWEHISNIICNILAIGVFIILILRYLFDVNLIDKWFEKYNRKYQAELDRTTNELQEKLRVEYGSLYFKRIETIERIYADILYLQHIIRGIDAAEVGYEEWRIVEDCNKACTTIALEIEKCRIYFSKTDDESLLTPVYNACKNFVGAYRVYQRSITEENHTDPNLQPIIFWHKHKSELVSLDTDNILKMILNRFRALIGVRE